MLMVGIGGETVGCACLRPTRQVLVGPAWWHCARGTRRRPGPDFVVLAKLPVREQMPRGCPGPERRARVLSAVAHRSTSRVYPRPRPSRTAFSRGVVPCDVFQSMGRFSTPANPVLFPQERPIAPRRSRASRTHAYGDFLGTLLRSIDQRIKQHSRVHATPLATAAAGRRWRVRG